LSLTVKNGHSFIIFEKRVLRIFLALKRVKMKGGVKLYEELHNLYLSPPPDIFGMLKFPA
jgi:hypothetical protein